jgi:dihydroorotate dehydrogenase
MIYKTISTLLQKADPELAHSLAIKFLKNNYLPLNLLASQVSPKLEINVLGKVFKNPIGLAAGFDKNAEIYNSIFKLGFGFAEVGTITPLPQYGNPKPRVFRLAEDEAIINRLGFPSLGMEKVKATIQNNEPTGILGINIGPNKESTSKIEDYLKCFEYFCNLCDYICINISSPNTPNLRDLHEKNKIEELLVAIKSKQKQLNNTTKVLLKISPDITKKNISELATIALNQKIDGVVLTNTTIDRNKNLKSPNQGELGGLSGKPLQQSSNFIIKEFYKIIEKKIPIIGVGGVFDGKSALDKIKSGASLIQLYTSMVYEGPYVANKINKELELLLETEGFENLKDAVGKDCI